ncbi:MAG: sulfur carrier protein ThiS [Burkholderiaceae bacterium]
MTLTINGTQQTFPAPPCVADVITRLALHGKRIAVERNGAIVPKSLYGQTILVDEDRLEIVVAVGGG